MLKLEMHNLQTKEQGASLAKEFIKYATRQTIWSCAVRVMSVPTDLNPAENKMISPASRKMVSEIKINRKIDSSGTRFVHKYK